MKILIWDKGLPLRNAGGPSGYLWNIKQYLDSVEDKDIIYYSDLIGTRKRGKGLVSSFLLGFCKVFRFEHWSHLIVNYFYKGALSYDERKILDGIDIVHFHTLSAACGYQRIMSKANIKTILTIHSPEPVIDEINSQDHTTMKFNRREKYISREIEIMKSADYLMFPVSGAIECYTSSSKQFKQFFENPETRSKMFFVPTSLPDKEKPLSENYLSKYSIPCHAKKICYVGRHSRIKGYDYLKEIARKVWEKEKDVYFIIGGKIDVEEPVRDDRWIELGWVNTISLLQEVDVFILPNQQTYFDIISLEILRNGTPLITTLTGGNHYFQDINNGGIVFIPSNNAKEAANIVINLLKSDMSLINTRKIFEDNFTMSKYIEAYKSKINSFV